MSHQNLPIVLGSASSERLVLLKSIGIIPDAVLSVDLDESERKKELHKDYCKRVAKEKFIAVSKIMNPKKSILITADTIGIASRQLLHKTYADEDIRKYLHLISGKRHRVITVVYCGIVENNLIESMKVRLVESTISIKRLDEREIEKFISSKEGYGKAGGYTIKGSMGAYIKQINGSFSSILGLPLYETKQLLNSYGYR